MHYTNIWYFKVSLMPRNTSVSLGDHFATFIDSQVSSGRFSSASDVLRAGLRLLEEDEAKLAALQKALSDGERSGLIDNFDPDAFLHELNTNAST
jgi:antitoxin ParD1/3/4